jgi:hypothetical protein
MKKTVLETVGRFNVLVGCHAAYTGINLPAFGESHCLHLQGRRVRYRQKVLRNVGQFIPEHSTVYPRRRQSTVIRTSNFVT